MRWRNIVIIGLFPFEGTEMKDIQEDSIQRKGDGTKSWWNLNCSLNGSLCTTGFGLYQHGINNRVHKNRYQTEPVQLVLYLTSTIPAELLLLVLISCSLYIKHYYPLLRLPFLNSLPPNHNAANAQFVFNALPNPVAPSFPIWLSIHLLNYTIQLLLLKPIITVQVQLRQSCVGC